MEIKILHSILHNELRPWMIKTGSINTVEILKRVGNKNPSNLQELTQYVRNLIGDYPILFKWIDKQNEKSDSSIINLYYNVELTAFVDVDTKFYAELISKETLRTFNVFLQRSATWKNKVEIIYNTNLLLKEIKALTKQVSKEIDDKRLDSIKEENILTTFVLQYLKHSLICLYFSVQQVFRNELDQTITLEDFYLLELNQPLEKMPDFTFSGQTTKDDNKTKYIKKLTFGFNGDKEKLKSVIYQLNTQIELLDEHTPSSALLEVLTSKSIIKKSVKIRLGCETVQFVYIINKLYNYFNNFTPKTIQESEIFFSKGNTLLKAQNMYKNKLDNPKNKEIIDNIIKHLQ